jgi:hypothetical protein
MSRLINNIENLVTVAITGLYPRGWGLNPYFMPSLCIFSHENYSRTGQTNYIFIRREFII